jgi:UDP-N-acetylglucosamine--N-acetylmuramyl-(pentapeptide) pyrophosphoryl-undecaprenol N-acetylglucosamine transferase
VAVDDTALLEGRVQGGALLILLTLGTHEQPFARAIDLIEPLARQEQLVIQHGFTPPRADLANVRWIDFLEHEELIRLAADASAVVCHAGVGSIMTVLGLGKTPVLIPRLKAFGEHVDDHQLQIARELESAGVAVAYTGEGELAEAIEAASGHASSFHSGGALREAIVAAVGPLDEPA